MRQWRWVAAAVVAAIVLALPPAAQAAFPGVNGRIAFSSNRDGDYDIYTMNPDGSDVRQLTDDPMADYTPAWSADGTKIASERDDPCCSGGGSSIWVMNSDGSGQTMVANVTRLAYKQPAWSPDGQRITLTMPESHCDFSGFRQGLPLGVLVMNADGTDLHKVACFGYDSGASWSPDGEKIAWSTHAPYSYIVSINAADGTGLANLTFDTSLVDGNPNWSPDGQQIVFNRSDFSTLQRTGIYTMNRDGSNQTRIALTGTDPAWSPNGAKIAFGTGEIVVMNANGSVPTQITNDPAIDREPDWQPVAGADLVVTKTDSPDPVLIGEPLTYTIQVTNNGPTPARDVKLDDLLSKRLRLRSLRSTHGHCRALHRLVSCRLGDLASGESATVTINVRPIRSGSITNTATVSAAQPPDPVPGNNSASATTTVER